jgi:hypothetical protein
MNRKLLILPFAIAFAMLLNPVFAATTTYHSQEKEAIAILLYDEIGNKMVVEIAEEKNSGSTEMETSMHLALMGPSWGLWETDKTLAPNECKWSSGECRVSTAIDYNGAAYSMIVEWFKTGPTERQHFNKLNDHDLHIIHNSAETMATATATIGEWTFTYANGVSSAQVDRWAETIVSKQ